MAHKGFTDMASRLAGRDIAADNVKTSLDHAVQSLIDKGATKEQIKTIMADGLQKLNNAGWHDYLGQWLPKWSIFN